MLRSAVQVCVWGDAFREYFINKLDHLIRYSSSHPLIRNGACMIGRIVKQKECVNLKIL